MNCRAGHYLAVPLPSASCRNVGGGWMRGLLGTPPTLRLREVICMHPCHPVQDAGRTCPNPHSPLAFSLAPTVQFLTSFEPLLKCHLLSETCPDHPVSNGPPLPVHSSYRLPRPTLLSLFCIIFATFYASYISVHVGLAVMRAPSQRVHVPRGGDLGPTDRAALRMLPGTAANSTKAMNELMNLCDISGNGPEVLLLILRLPAPSSRDYLVL